MIGLGNPILGDDGVGWVVARQILARADLPDQVEVDMLSLGGISLMERLIGYRRAILVDAIVTGQQPLGTVCTFSLEALPRRAAGHLSSAHDATLQDALEMGKSMGASLPEEITVVAIESQNVYEFSEELTPAVASAVPEAVQTVLNLLKSSPRSAQAAGHLPAT